MRANILTVVSDMRRGSAGKSSKQFYFMRREIKHAERIEDAATGRTVIRYFLADNVCMSVFLQEARQVALAA